MRWKSYPTTRLNSEIREWFGPCLLPFNHCSCGQCCDKCSDISPLWWTQNRKGTWSYMNCPIWGEFVVLRRYLALSCSISQPGDSFLDGLLVVKVFSILFGSHRRDICHNQIHLALRSHTSRCTIHSIYTVHRTLPSRCHYQWTTSWPATEIWTTYTTPCRLGSPVDLIYQREELSLTRQPEIKKANLNNTLKCEKVVFLWSYWEGYIYPKKQGTSQITGARLLFFPVLDND